MTTRTQSRRWCSAAFTLIELLVVVAIIAVLISILLPALSRAKQQALQLQCNTNLRSMGQAALLYADENKGYIVRTDYEDGPGRDNIHPAMTLLPGLGYDGKISGVYRERRPNRTIQIFATIPTLQCPTFRNPDQSLDYIFSAFPIPYTRTNVDLDVAGGGAPGDGTQGQDQGNSDYVKFFALSSFGRYNPSRFIYVTEVHQTTPHRALSTHDMWFASQLPFGAFPRISNDRHHPGGVNALFFDGSARTIPLETLDAGWPQPLSLRLRWFTVVPPALEL